ncbi:MAG TPA: N-6 DNA methylase [Blastocatellia bacterium]
MSAEKLQLTDVQQYLWGDLDPVIPTEHHLLAAALELGAHKVKPWSGKEAALASAAKICPSRKTLAKLRELILSGADPLGEAFCTIRSSDIRRESGAIYTPHAIVETMVSWADGRGSPARIIDPGAGSGRFLLSAAKAFPGAELVGIDTDPLAALVARANLAVAGLQSRARIVLSDYRTFNDSVDGQTLYIGNPPYVRHHRITPRWKEWLSKEAAQFGLTASKLAGLHIHFFLATARNARAGDFGAFITSAEWLDVNYGALMRSLILGQLGGQSLTVIEPTAQPFPDAATTGAITTFEIASKPSSVFFRRVDSLRDLGGLGSGHRVRRDRLASESRWSYLTRSAASAPEGFVELGDLCRVHRGQVTGANDVWIAGQHARDLPSAVLYRSVTRARELFEAEGVLEDPARLRFVIDIQVDLDALDAADRGAVDRFLEFARARGAHKGYIARHRKAWWAVGLRAPAPIISTYMARRPPAFVVNRAKARHINIAHGLYPRDPMSDTAQMALVDYLRSNTSQRSGRTYAGGLTKFEPREMERLIVPGPALLEAGVIE